MGHIQIRRSNNGNAQSNLKERLLMQHDKLLRAAIFVTRLRDSSTRDHGYRIRCAKNAIDLLNDFIATEAQAANSENKEDRAHMSWLEIAKTLGISKSAAFTRYGAKSDKCD